MSETQSRGWLANLMDTATMVHEALPPVVIDGQPHGATLTVRFDRAGDKIGAEFGMHLSDPYALAESLEAGEPLERGELEALADARIAELCATLAVTPAPGPEPEPAPPAEPVTLEALATALQLDLARVADIHCCYTVPGGFKADADGSRDGEFLLADAEGNTVTQLIVRHLPPGHVDPAAEAD